MTLAEYLSQTGTPMKAVAEAAGTSPGYIHDIANGRRTPGLQMALRIVAATGGQVSVESLSAAPSTGAA